MTNVVQSTFFALLIAIGFTLSTSAQTTVITTNYYVVTGSTLPDIQASLARARPDKTQSAQDGLTVWQVDWHFSTLNSASGCRVSTFNTAAKITITLPRWVGSTNASQELKTEWQRYLRALAEHEYGHAQNGLAAAKEIQERLRQPGEDSTCEALRQRLHLLCQTIVNKRKAADQAYDQRTNHGATEGARFGRRKRPDGPRANPF
jgi:predicted secreted Zn-dependent protease